MKRAPFLAAAMAALVWGLWLGLGRMAAAPVTAPLQLPDHGPLMVGGFLGTVISLERAVASGRRWSFAAPALCALGVALILAGLRVPGAFALAAGSAVVVAVLAQVVRAAPALHHVVLAVSGVAWLAGNLLLARQRPVFDVVPLWIVFLVGTIAAERLELTRVLPRSRAAVGLFVASFALFCVAATSTLQWRDEGVRLMGVAELALCAWLLRFDVARRTVRQKGAVRYIAAALLAGYAWLGAAGAIMCIYGHPIAGPRYDALIHAVFVGFVFSMIFGHALVILPAVVRIRVTFHRRFYVHLVLLHASLAARLAGDFAGSAELRRAGGWMNAIAILLFVVSTALSLQRVPRGRPVHRDEARVPSVTPADASAAVTR